MASRELLVKFVICCGVTAGLFLVASEFVYDPYPKTYITTDCEVKCTNNSNGINVTSIVTEVGGKFYAQSLGYYQPDICGSTVKCNYVEGRILETLRLGVAEKNENNLLSLIFIFLCLISVIFCLLGLLIRWQNDKL